MWLISFFCCITAL